MADVQITGVDELNAKLAALTYETRRKGGRAALRRAAMVIVNQAKTNAAQLDDAATGRSIANNIAARWSSRFFKQTGGDMMFRVGVQGGARVTEPGNPDTGSGGPTPHWRFLELGTSEHAARPFLRPAAEQKSQQVMDTFMMEYNKAIDRAIKRGAR